MHRSLALLLLGSVFAAAAGIPAAARSGPVVVRAAGTRAPTFVRMISSGPMQGPAGRAAVAHLSREKDRYGIKDPAGLLRLQRVDRRQDRVDVTFEQIHRGVPVWGARYIVHMEDRADGFVVDAVNGRVFTELTTQVAPAFDRDVAASLVRARLARGDVIRVHPHGLVVLPFESGVPVYHFTVEGSFFGRRVQQEVFVNAVSGAIALTFDNLPHDGPVTATGTTSHGDQVSLGAYERGSVIEMRDQSKPMFSASGGEITTHDAGRKPRYLATDQNIVTSGSLQFGDGATRSGAVDAHHGASQVYDFYKALGRDSLDGQGMSIVSTVNATERDGSPMYNAFWDGINEQMVYGNPDPEQFHPFSAELDVVGHELTHGVTQHSGNLAYIGQSGAMNEAYSDYFGNAIDVTISGTAMTDPEAGYIGEGLCKSSRTSAFVCPLRDLNDGSTTADYIYFLADIDNGGVHLNSTIYGGALWDVREALGADADRIIYRALEGYTTPLDRFIDGRNAILAAADELGTSADDRAAIEAAFDEHGIVEGWDAAPSNDARVLMDDVAPVSDVGFSIPRLDGDRFVIADYADKGDMCCVGLQIFTGTTREGDDAAAVNRRVPGSGFTDEMPDVSGDRIVWSRIQLSDASPVSSQIKARVIGGRAATVVRGGMFMNPSIDGRLVAWESLGRNFDIWARYLGRRVRVVATDRGDQMWPQVAGDWVAWWDARGPRIGLMNLATGRRRTVRPSDRFAFVGPPALTRRYLFWFEAGTFESRGSIVRMDLRTGRRQVVIRAGSEDAPVWVLSVTAPPVVSANGSYFVYSSEIGYDLEFSGRPGAIRKDEVGRDIFIAPISGGDAERVTGNRADQAYPMIGIGRRVVWLDSAEGQTDLVTREVP